MEWLQPGESEDTAALRLLNKLPEVYGSRFFDILLLDALYAQTPVLQSAAAHGWELVISLKRNRPQSELYASAVRLFAHRPPDLEFNETMRGKTYQVQRRCEVPGTGTGSSTIVLLWLVVPLHTSSSNISALGGAVTKRFTFGAFLLAALIVAQPQPAHAVAVGAALCAVQQYPCAAGNILDSGVRTNFVNFLPANTWTTMPYFFQDAAVRFSGRVIAVDLAGQFIYLWATGTATDRRGGALNLDVAFQQRNYRTINGNWTFNDILIGGCGGGVGAGSNAVGQGIVDNTGLSVLTGNCNAFALAGAPVNGLLVGPTTLTAAAQFNFRAGSAPGSQIALPWGADFPDPNQFGGDFPTLSQLQNDPNLTQLTTPEPGTYGLLGSALLGLAFVRRRRR